MKRFPALVLVAIALSTVTPAVASAASKLKPISYVSVVTKEKQTGPSTFVQYANDLKGAVKIGTDVFTCSVHNNGTLYKCRYVVTLAKGTISFTAKIGSTQTSGSMALVRGTGEYAGVKGSATYKQVHKDTKTDITITFD